MVNFTDDNIHGYILLWMENELTLTDGLTNEIIPGPPTQESTFQPIREVLGEMNTWDTSQVTNMSGLFNWKNTDKYGDVSGSNVETEFKNFNEDISNWDTSNVTNMESMFHDCNVFNADIGKWNTSKVTNMKDMFHNANLFNQNVNTKPAYNLNGEIIYIAWKTYLKACR